MSVMYIRDANGNFVPIKTIQGEPGKSAYEYAKENGYTGTETEFGIKLAKDIPIITQEAGHSTSLVMSQKAVTDLVADALEESSKTEYETVDSVAEMTDTNKSYVLSSTGTLWAYGQTATDPPELYDPGAASVGYRHGSGTTGATTSGGAANYIMTDYIPVDMSAADPKLKIYGNINLNSSDGPFPSFYKIGYYDGNKTCLGSKLIDDAAGANYIEYEQGDGFLTLFVGKSNGAKETYYASIAYVRIDFMPSGSAAAASEANMITSIINPDAGGIGYQWYDTGMTPESAGNGNYVDLLVKVNENAAGIAEVSARVTALESGSGTLTVPSFWQDAVDACISKIKALQVGKNCITFPFFSDNHQRNGYAGVLIAKVMQECHIPYCFYGGDSISNGTIADEAEMIAQDKAFDTSMSYIPNGRLCRAVGNHDGYWYDGTNKFYYTREQVYELFLREESVAQNKHFGDDGTYYYVEDLASKVRFIVLNTNGGSVDDAQIAWFRDTALKVETGWSVVVISHQPISNHYHALISNAADVRAIATESGVDIIGWFSGHIHRDRIYTGAATNTEDDSEGDAMGFTQVTITSDHTGIAYDDATKHTVANDDQSHAIDFVTINRNTRTVNLTRLGIGQDRSFSY